MKNLLLIDGSYIGYRSLFSLGKRMGYDILLETNEEMRLFEEQVYNDTISIYKSFNANVAINNVMLFIDKNSWRHFENMHRPYYENEDKPIGYKENRKDLKDKSGVNWVNYKECLSNTAEKVNEIDGFLGMNVEMFEADDLIFLTANHFSGTNNIFIFANDGDYQQAILNNNVYYVRNNISQKNPFGTIIVHKDYTKPVTINMSGIEILQNKMRNSSGLLNQISKIEVGNNQPGRVERTFKNGFICKAEPYWFGFIKAIIGDKKDNILPIIGRKSKTGRLTRVLEKNILFAFDNLRTGIDNFGILDIDKKTNNELAEIIIRNVRENSAPTPIVRTFLIDLISQLNQQSESRDVYVHLKLNIKIMMLTELVHNDEVLARYTKLLPLISNKLNEKILLDNDDNDNTEIINNSGNVLDDILHQAVPTNNE